MAGTGQISYCFFYMDTFPGVTANIHTSPPPPLQRATEIQIQGGFQKEAISEGVGEASWGLFLEGGPSKIGELLKN